MSTTRTGGGQQDDATLEAAVMKRVFWRLMPFLLAAYLVAYIDRVNVGFASLQMNKALGIDPTIFGLGAGIFFIGYFILEVPSNLGLERFGASRWIARIMISWGIISGACALITGSTSFLVLRFLLGAAEAGFFPGVILYLTYWFPSEYRAKIVGIFMVAIPVAGLTGSPISGAILGLDGVLGLGGWQWVFVLEAIPAVLMGVFSFVWLTDRPENATWLSPAERAWLTGKLASERSRTTKVKQLSVWQTMVNKHVLVMALVYSGAAGASSAMAVWQPQVIKSFGLSNLETGFLNAVPYAISAVWMVLWGRSSDRTGERVWHNALPLGWMGLAMIATFWAPNLWVLLPILTLVLAGTYASKGPFWALSSEWLSAPVAAVGLAQINALGNLSGFFANFLIGWIKSATGSFPLAIMPIAILALVGTVAVLLVGRGQPRTVPVSPIGRSA
ncbi:MAG TPA: MFS transporter [Rhodopila sp.]|uniref:MFS transporter n=1 Tax=Rhodopila sp. TaxID=2480087 RepID=UPI002C78DF1C|nr:MFS transporter [Rhodopila sp.]HVY16478.1 MFS transporter [Rhodopila sp.]